MFKVVLSALLLLLTCRIKTTLPSSDEDRVSIIGRAVDQNGQPVVNAVITVYSFAPHTGVIPIGKTDSEGAFSLLVPAIGEGVVSGMKTSDGYPDAELALYGKGEYATVIPVDVKAGATPIKVELRFSSPDALVEWKVLSDTGHTPVRGARFKIAWADDPRIYVSSTVPETGTFLFVLPKHPVSIRISSPGFKDWSTAELSEGKLLLKPGTHDARSILLKPSL